MTKLKQIRKKALSLALAIITAGYMIAVPKQVQAEQEKKPSIELKIEDVFDYNHGFRNDKLRTTIDYDKLSFRLDKNQGRQSQYMLSLKAVNKKNTKLTILHSGNIEEKIKDKYYSQTYDFGAAFSQYLGKIPIIGETTLKATQINSLKKGSKPYQKLNLKLEGKHLDLAYQASVKRDRTIDPQYYIAYHNNYLHTSLGKTKGKQIEGALVTKNMPDLSIIAFGNYDLESRIFSITSVNAYKNGDPEVYNQDIARLVSNLLTLGTVEINFPIFPTYLNQGELTHRLDLEITPTHYKMANEIGKRIAKNAGVGAGFLAKKQKNSKPELSLILSGYFKTKVLGQDIYFEGSLKDGKIGCYAYTQVRF